MQPQADYKYEPTEQTAVLPIDVTRTINGAFLAGTFTQPPPLVRVKLGTNIEFQLRKAHSDDTFVVNFQDGSPFSINKFASGAPKSIRALSERTGALRAVIEGSFHYEIFVTDGETGVVYPIHDCPQIVVDGSN